jgi:hypothetical protein
VMALRHARGGLPARITCGLIDILSMACPWAALGAPLTGEWRSDRRARRDP